MNPIEKPKGVKLWKKQKVQKQNSDNSNMKKKFDAEVETNFTKPEVIQDASSKMSKKRKHNKNVQEATKDLVDMSSNQLVENQSFGKKRKKVESLTHESNQPKSILKKRQSERNDFNLKKKAKDDGLTSKERKILHLNKKAKESSQVTEDTTPVNMENLTKKEWKKLKMQKKGKSEHFEISQTLINLWEHLRREKCEPERKRQLLKQACDLLKGRVKEFTFAHDSVRVLECILSEGAETHRTLLFEELKNDILPLSKSKYGKFFVIKLLKYGSKQQKDHVMKAFHGKIVKLIRHTEAAEVVELAFNECANATQRFEFVQEFYGSTFMFFKTHEVSSLNELLQKEPSKKSLIIQNMKAELMKVLDKSVVRHSIVHHVLWQFMAHADAASKSEIIEAVRDVVPEILHTKDGSRVGMHCVWYGTLRDRKVIIKAMKTFVAKIAMEEHGHMVLLTLFDCLDDIIFLKKHIIKELVGHLLELSMNLHGKKVLIYLLNPRDSHYIHPDVINILKQGDGNETSKKDPEVRRSELKAIIADPLLKLIESNIQKLYTDNAFCLFTLVILKHTVGNRRNAFRAIADLVVEPYTSENKNTHAAEHSGSNFMFKQLIIHDKEESKDDVKFSEVLCETVPNLVFKSWMECNRGAFLLVSLLETEIPSVVDRIKQELSGCKRYLSKKPYKGAEILIKKLK